MAESLMNSFAHQIMWSVFQARGVVFKPDRTDIIVIISLVDDKQLSAFGLDASFVISCTVPPTDYLLLVIN
mgnify:CR=1 FL=1